MKPKATTRGGAVLVMETTLFLVSLCGAPGVHAGEVTITEEGVAIQISSSQSENLVLDATGATPFKLEFSGLDDDLYRLWWRDKADRRRFGPVTFTPVEGAFTVDLPEAPNGISIRVTPLRTSEKEIADALGGPLAMDHPSKGYVRGMMWLFLSLKY